MIKVFIVGHHKVEVEHEKSYTVYDVDVYVEGRKHTVSKRYSQFEDLHKKLKKKVQTPEFPPKKVMKWSHKVLEQRQQALEAYVQAVVQADTLHKVVLKFLRINSSHLLGSVDSLDQMPDDDTMGHQAVIAFTENLYLESYKNSLIEDIVEAGVMIGLFGDTYDAS